jgi:hypothetical protein
MFVNKCDSTNLAWIDFWIVYIFWWSGDNQEVTSKHSTSPPGMQRIASLEVKFIHLHVVVSRRPAERWRSMFLRGFYPLKTIRSLIKFLFILFLFRFEKLNSNLRLSHRLNLNYLDFFQLTFISWFIIIFVLCLFVWVLFLDFIFF